MKPIIILFAIWTTLQAGSGPVRESRQNETGRITYRRISFEDYADKVAGGWVGQAIGALFGEITEHMWQGEIVPFDMTEWYRLTPDIKMRHMATQDSGLKEEFLRQLSNYEKYVPEKMSDQDDLYIEFMFLYSIFKNGLDVTAVEMAEDWLRYLDPDRIWCANKNAYENFRRGIWPPFSGFPENNSFTDAIDFQIESDLFGLISPGMPNVSNAWANKVGHIMNHGEGVYAGMAMAAMYSEAFFESDPYKLAKYSLKAIPQESDYAGMVRDVLDLHLKYLDWKDAWRQLEQKWGRKNGELVSSVYVPINGAYVYLGLLYGEGDFWKSMNIAMRCGRDSDCNPSSCAGILGTILGLKGIPAKWAILRDLPVENCSIAEIYPEEIDWDNMLKATLEIGKWNVLENGGYLEKGLFYIPFQEPASFPLKKNSISH